jgi:hypothetical protein
MKDSVFAILQKLKKITGFSLRWRRNATTKMKFSKAATIIQELDEVTGFWNPNGDKGVLAGKAATIMLYCSANNNWDIRNAKAVSGYTEDELGLIFCNLADKGHLMQDDSPGGWCLVLQDPENEETNVMEFLAVACDVAGIVLCGNEDNLIQLSDIPLNWPQHPNLN